MIIIPENMTALAIFICCIYCCLIIVTTSVTWMDHILDDSRRGKIYDFYISGRFTTTSIYRKFGCLKLVCGLISFLFILINPIWSLMYLVVKEFH